MRLSWTVVVIVLALPLPARSQEAAVAAPPPRQTDDVTDRRALERIRAALESASPPLSEVTRLARNPTFRVEVVGRRFNQITFAETLRQEWQPVQPGLFYHNELVYRFTPPQARPYGAFTGPELVQVAASSLANALLVKAVVLGSRAVRAGVRHVQATRVNREIDRALAEIDARRRAQESAGAVRQPVTRQKLPSA